MICADASLAVKWILPEEDSEQALALLHEWVNQGERIVAPPLLPVEVSNILRQRTRTGELSLDEAMMLLSRFLALPVNLVAPAELYQAALPLAADHELGAVYDAQCLALAQLLGCEMWTADRRLLRQLAGKLSYVKSLSEYQV